MSKKFVTKLTTKDQNTLKAFADVGYLKHDMIKDLGLSERRIKAYEHDNLIERKDYLNKETKNIDSAYRLTDKGKDLMRREFNREYFYKSSSPAHDLKLAERYMNETEEHRTGWITENQWRDELKEHIESFKDTSRYEELNRKLEEGLISPPDGGYRVGSSTVAIEVETAAYSAADRAAKIEFKEVLQIDLQTERG